MSATNIIGEMIMNQRGLTRWYLKKIEEKVIHKRLEVKDKKLNSPYWIAGHIIWADQFLCLGPLGLKKLDLNWVSKFEFQSDGDIKDGPTFDEIYTALKISAEQVQEQLVLFGDARLEEPFPLSQLGFKNIKLALFHLIRHEGVHCGQLSWFCAMNGIKTL